MQQYMKSAMPFYGIPAAARRKLQTGVFVRFPMSDTDELIGTARSLWDDATHREERYASIDLVDYRGNRTLEDLRCLPMYESWIVEGAWWDYCDDVSGNRIKSLLLRYPSETKPHLLSWAKHQNFWLRRASIICQRTMGDNTDARLLYACILPSMSSEEFFLRKGIGWALRARAYDAPEEVVAFVKEYRSALSPLTKREALKVLIKQGIVKRIPD